MQLVGVQSANFIPPLQHGIDCVDSAAASPPLHTFLLLHSPHCITLACCATFVAVYMGGQVPMLLG